MSDWNDIRTTPAPAEEWLLVAIKGYVSPTIAAKERDGWYEQHAEYPLPKSKKVTHWLLLPSMPAK